MPSKIWSNIFNVAVLIHVALPFTCAGWHVLLDKFESHLSTCTGVHMFALKFNKHFEKLGLHVFAQI